MSKKKCPICGTKMKIDTSAVCTSIPPKYRCVCPSCNCLDFIETSEYDQYKEEPSLPSDLDEAAEEYGRNAFINECMENGVCDDHDLSDAFKAGAEWMAGQGHAFETIMQEDDVDELVPTCPDMYNLGYSCGDKVIVQIRKK